MFRHASSSLLLAGSLALGLTACGDDDDMMMVPDGGMADGGMTDGEVPGDGAVPDGEVPDGGMADAATSLTISGTVYGEGASDRMPDAGIELWDGGAPDGAVITPGGRIIGAMVYLKTLTGETIATSTTDGIGEYTIEGPADDLAFLQVEPVTGYAGSIRAEQTRGMDYEAFDMVLPEMAGLDLRASQAGITRDPALGWIACGFNPVDNMAGGEGAELGGGVSSDSPFNITDVGVILDNRLAPLCEAGGGNPPGALPGAMCTEDDRARQIFFPNVDASFAPINPLDPASGTCQQRFEVSEWLTAPSSLTVVNIDCMP